MEFFGCNNVYKQAHCSSLTPIAAVSLLGRIKTKQDLADSGNPIH